MSFAKMVSDNNKALSTEYVGTIIHIMGEESMITGIKMSEPDGYGGYLLDVWYSNDKRHSMIPNMTTSVLESLL